MAAPWLLELQRWALPNLGWLLVTQAAAVLLLLLWLLRLRGELGRVRRSYQTLAHGVRDENLETLLERHLRRIDEAEGLGRRLQEQLAQLARHEREALQYVGLVHYDAFGDIGGLVSFVVCLLDDHRNGYLLNSIFGREGSTVYAKVVRGGQAQTSLSDEEAEALDQALGKARAAVAVGG